MNTRVWLGSVTSYLYNAFVGRIPLGVARNAFLAMYLGRIGRGTSVQTGCRFLNGRKVHFGERNVISFGCLFDGRRFHVRTGDDVSIGPEATILTLGHDPQSANFADRGGDVIIANRVWIGCRALVLPAVDIGEGAVVGAGAVVTKNVDSFSIVAGNPARKIGERNRDLRYSLDFRPLFL
jgi:maltose O-acetyltransferase